MPKDVMLGLTFHYRKTDRLHPSTILKLMVSLHYPHADGLHHSTKKIIHRVYPQNDGMNLPAS